MPWVVALLRGQRVYARAEEDGRFRVVNRKVEIRYKPTDGRRYDALVDNLKVADPTVLPDATCAEAAAVPSTKGAGAGGPLPEGAIVAYTDGACSGNPGPAGLGVVVIDGHQRVERSEYLGEATNNVAELTAILRALEEVPAARPAVVHTDSQYAIGVLDKGWKAKANVELIASIKQALKGRTTHFRYVRGHAGHPLNERADALAREAIVHRSDRRVALSSLPRDATTAATPPAK